MAILREEGSNGDREMADAFHLAGFEVSRVQVELGALIYLRPCPLMPLPLPCRCGM